jgi:hypothetical protein
LAGFEDILMNDVVVSRDTDLKIWNTQLIKGMINVMAGLSQMGKNEIKIKSITTGSSSLENIRDILGDDDTDIFGVQINCTKSVQQQLVIICQLNTVFKILNMVKEKFSETWQEKEYEKHAALGEVGYVIGKSFLSSILNINNQGFNSFQTTIIIDKVKQVSELIASNILQDHKDILFTDTTIIANSSNTLRTVFLITGTKNLLNSSSNLSR